MHMNDKIGELLSAAQDDNNNNNMLNAMMKNHQVLPRQNSGGSKN